MNVRIHLALLLSVFALHGIAQSKIKDSMYSKSIGEQRNLIIQLPKEYKPGSADKYPVLYLLDGEWNDELFQQTQRWAQQWEFTPPVIMVGVANSYPKGENQRFRDLTPTAGGNKQAGGGPKLLSFLKDELVPYINKTYPSNGSNTLWGHSLGGLFVLYTLFTEPQLFDSYIAADPSCWWDHGWLKAYARDKMKDVKGVKSLYITGRSGPGYHEMGIDSFLMVLKAIAPPTLLWDDIAYPNETHVSQQGKSAYDGLKYTLTPGMVNHFNLNPMAGTVVKGMPFTFISWDWMTEKNVRYTTDGTEPTLTSARLKQKNTVTPTGDVELRIKSFFANDTLDKKLSVSLKAGKMMAGVKKPESAVRGAWKYACYRTADEKEMIKTGLTTDEVDLNNVDSITYFGRVTGYLETERKGYYTFLLGGEPGTKFYLGDQLILEMPAGADFYSVLVPLDKGFYPVRYEYVHQKNGKGFGYGYRLPDEIDNGGIPDNLTYYVK